MIHAGIHRNHRRPAVIFRGCDETLNIAPGLAIRIGMKELEVGGCRVYLADNVANVVNARLPAIVRQFFHVVALHPLSRLDLGP